MASMATWKIEEAHVGSTSCARIWTARTALALGVVGWSVWITWRISHLTLHPVPLATLVLELAAVAAGVIVWVGLEREAPSSRGLDIGDRRDPYRFANAVADGVGRERPIDLHREVRAAVRQRRSSNGPRPLGDVVMTAVLLDGPRRLALVVILTLALLVGVAPIPTPSPLAAAGVCIGVLGLAVAPVILAPGRLRLGDRTRWSFATLGEAVTPTDRDGVAPRRWVGMVATVVGLNLAVALRGMSDRWTHGLPAMGDHERAVAMTMAMVVVFGALYALRTTIAPDLGDVNVVSRRFEERAARRSTLAAAVALGLVGLVAGILPAGVDAAGPVNSVRVEIEPTDERVVGVVPGEAVDRG
jgi:hypothetical protein